MLSIGDYVACGNKGVCIVDDIKKLDLSGTHQDDEYYILKSVYSVGSTMYLQVNQNEVKIRPILTRPEADALVNEIKGIQPFLIANEKHLENDYKSAVRSNDVRILVSLIKTIYERKERRLAAGKKETALDSKYFRLASDYLFGELAVSLEIQREDVEHYISQVGWHM